MRLIVQLITVIWPGLFATTQTIWVMLGTRVAQMVQDSKTWIQTATTIVFKI